jgi:hypothetical protein
MKILRRAVAICECEWVKTITTKTYHIIMLSGIKTGKRKRPASNTAGAANRPVNEPSSDLQSSSAPEPPARAAAAAPASNRSAADALRASLLSGSQPTKTHDKNLPAEPSLESRGRISNQIVSQDDAVVVNLPSADTSNALRYNSKGKLSRSQLNSLREKSDVDLTISEMIQQERSQTEMDEVYARNIAKMGKSYKKYDNMQQNSRSGKDEDDYLQETTILSDRLYRSSHKDSIAPSLQAAKEMSRSLAQHSVLEKWKAKSWWWMESPSFDKRNLIALGDKVSLVLVPSKYSLVEGHCYIVPLSYSESFVNLDEEVWYEINRFQSSLSQLYAKSKKKLIFLETVSRTSSSGGTLQCRMEIIPVSSRVEADAPFYFKSSLEEMAQEWGTHQKPIVLGSKKTLRNAVPKNFPYFYCGWEDGGYVQLIEGEDDGLGGSGEGEKNRYRDFGLDTVAGMMGMDPYRMRKKDLGMEEEKRGILKFCEGWKEVDWTTELDG